MKSAIIVENLSKAYRIGLEEKKSDTLAGAFVQALTSPIRNFRNIASLSKLKDSDESLFWALRDVNFEVKQGEVLGIIGHNGAGKSTLLKILSRITEPTNGKITIHGRVSSLLEVGTGFHPDLTGRENIYMNGTILGMTKREIDSKLEEIIEFSGVRKHIDTPVKRYSSGMTVRLAFSVAAHLEPEILIIDEVLAVGDAEFQKKCIKKMEDVSRGSGKTVLLVSHNLTSIKSICSSAILLDHGRIIERGRVGEVINRYLMTGKKHIGDFVFDDFAVRSIKLEPETFFSDNDLRITATLAVNDCRLKSFVWILYSDLGDRIGIVDLRDMVGEVNHKGALKISVDLKKLKLVEGNYKLGFYYETSVGFQDIDEGIDFSVGEEVSSEYMAYDKSVRGFVNFNYVIHR